MVLCVRGLSAVVLALALIGSQPRPASAKTAATLPLQTMAQLAESAYDVAKARGYRVVLARHCWRFVSEERAPGPLCRRYMQFWADKSPEGFVTRFVYRGRGGVSAAVFEHKQTARIVLAFTGSDQLVDWVGANQNILRPRGKTRPPLQRVAAETLKIVEQVRRLKKRDGSAIRLREIDVVGHSLGGYLTQLVTALFPVRSGVSFNGPGLYRLVSRPEDELETLLGSQADRYRRRYPAARMQNHVKRLDPVGRFGRHFGVVYIYEAPAKNAHSMALFRKELEEGSLEIVAVR